MSRIIGSPFPLCSGVPDPRTDHAVAMARFAVRCVQTMRRVTKELELSLGPDTTDLGVRIGLHSGPVTAGVLRGDRARFQLFGDTMNTAARMESNGAPGRIHISQETADLLDKAGKSSWFVAREGTVMAKGKGALRTYWLAYQSPPENDAASAAETNSTATRQVSARKSGVQAPPQFGVHVEDFLAPEERRRRLVEYNKEILLGLLKRVVAFRRAKFVDQECKEEEELTFSQCSNPVDEVAEVIEIPDEDDVEEASDDVSEEVEEQLELYISDIAGMYKNNPFHNFEHGKSMVLLRTVLSPEFI